MHCVLAKDTRWHQWDGPKMQWVPRAWLQEAQTSRTADLSQSSNGNPWNGFGEFPRLACPSHSRLLLCFFHLWHPSGWDNRSCHSNTKQHLQEFWTGRENHFQPWTMPQIWRLSTLLWSAWHWASNIQPIPSSKQRSHRRSNRCYRTDSEKEYKQHWYHQSPYNIPWYSSEWHSTITCRAILQQAINIHLSMAITPAPLIDWQKSQLSEKRSAHLKPMKQVNYINLPNQHIWFTDDDSDEWKPGYIESKDTSPDSYWIINDKTNSRVRRNKRDIKPRYATVAQ